MSSYGEITEYIYRNDGCEMFIEDGCVSVETASSCEGGYAAFTLEETEERALLKFLKNKYERVGT